MQTFVGDIDLFAFPRVPTGWFACDGTKYPISQYEALYALIGTTYGGDGQTSFAVPDLRGRALVHTGQGTGLSNYVMGQASGTESVTLLTSQLAAHTHTVACTSGNSNTNDPTGAIWGVDPTGTFSIYATPPVGGPIPTATTMSPQATSNSGGSQPHENRSPFLAMNYCICWAGIYPSQS